MDAPADDAALALDLDEIVLAPDRARLELRLAAALSRWCGARALRLGGAPPRQDDWFVLPLRAAGTALGRLALTPVPDDLDRVERIAHAAALGLLVLDASARLRASAEAAADQLRLAEAALGVAARSSEGAMVVDGDGTVVYGDRPSRLRDTPGVVWRTGTIAELPGYRVLLPYDPERRVDRRVTRLREDWRLTPTQCRVLAHLARGLANKEIAELMHISDTTVETHVTAVLRAAEAPNRSALVARFWSQG